MSSPSTSRRSSSLIETFGNPNYRPLTAQSLKNLERRYVQAKEKEKQRTLSRVSMLSVIEEEEEAEGRVPDVDLLDGKAAPQKLGKFPKKLYGKPIEELDDARSIDRTFNVVGRRFKSSSIYRFSSTRSCYIFAPINPIRRFTLLLLTNQFFDIVVMFTILANCIFLALDQPRFKAPGQTQPPQSKPAYLKIAEYVFTAIYSFEMFVKIIARGFILEKFTYLRDPWNWLDFCVILLAYVTFTLEGLNLNVGNFSGLRTFRVLRALKTISVVPGLKSIINALLRSTKMLAEVLLLTVFVLAIFALLALQLFMGTLRHKCVVDYDITINNDSETAWSLHVMDENNWYKRFDEPLVCSNISAIGVNNNKSTGWSGCPLNYTCLKGVGDNPNFGYTSFDNFGWAMITSFQLITLDYWEDVYNQIIRATGPWSMFFFFMTVMFGSFYLINLMLAVVSMAYTEEMENQGKEKEMEAERQKKQNVMELNPEKLRKIAERKRKKLEKQREKQALLAAANAGNETSDQPGAVNAGFTGDKQLVVPFTNADNTSDNVSRVSANQNTSVENVNGADATEDDAADTTGSTNQEDNDSLEEEGIEDPDKSMGQDQGPVECCPYKSCCQCCRTNCICSRRAYRYVKKLQYYAGYIILDPLVDLLITICICLNTLFLSIHHHGIPKSTEDAVERGNLVFTAIFTIECVMKITALDKRYFKNSWNIFDFFIVIMSLVEIPLTGVEGLSVLRTFRLLRVLKLAQSWTTMRNLLAIIGSTVGAIGNVSVVLIIIIYIFAIIGMQLFGKDYTAENFPDEGIHPRWNFRDFFHSLMMVFRILCGEWIEPLYDCMRASETGACIAVIIATFFCGNVMILNLFLALLLNSFASDSLKNKKEEISRLTLAIDKLKRWFWVAFNCCVCRRRKCKVGSTESLRNDEKEKDSTNIKPDIVMVVEDDDKISQIISLHDSGKVTTIEMTRVDTISGEKNNSTLMVHRRISVTGSNGHIMNGHSNPPSRKGSAVSVKEFDRPKSRAAFTDPAKDSVTTGNGSLKVSRLTPLNGSLSNGSVQNGHVQNGSIVNGSIGNGSISNGSASNGSVVKSKNAETGEEETSKTKTEVAESDRENEKDEDDRSIKGKDEKDEGEEEEELQEDRVKDCFPEFMNDYFRRKFPCACCKTPEHSPIMQKWHAFRNAVCFVVEHRFFEWFILVIIFASSITLTFEDIYLDNNPPMKRALNWLNFAFAMIFIVEMTLKWIGMGFKRYFTNFWCWLDFFIVMIAVLGILADAIGLSGVGAFRALRTLRALRPLRAISRWQGMKIVVNALTHAIPAIINVVFVILCFWLIFSIVGVQFFGGTFYKCLDDDGNKVNLSIVTNVTDCKSMNYSWVNSEINFDNILHGYVALFQVATFEGWMEVMEDAVDARGVDLQPSRESQPAAYIFFVLFIVVGSFFTLNLFIGVIIENFNALKRKYEGDSSFDMFLTSNQKNYYQTMRRLGTKKPTKQIKQPTDKIRIFFFNLTNNTKFEVFIVSIIFFNMVAMMVEHYGMDPAITNVLSYFNIIFTAIFTVECILKLIGLGIYYFKVPWNLFDFIVVALSLMGIILQDALSNSFVNPTLLRVLRLFRIGRVLRLVKSAKGIRKLLFALVISLPALLNIGALLTLIIFIFSIVGMSQFGYVRHNEGIDEVVNFETWINSMMLLFRIASSAGWNDVLEPLMADKAPDCDPNYMGYENGDCGNKYFAIIFFMSFLVISFLVIINMYIAVILENFGQAHAQEEVGITEDDFVMFYQVWESYDPNASQFINYEYLSEFCDKLENPLRLAKPNHIKIAGLDLPIYDDCKLHCLDVLFALTKRVLGDVEESADFEDLQNQMAEKFAESFPDRQNHQPTTTTMQIKKRLTAAKVIQRAYRLYRLKREINKASSIYRQTKSSAGNSRASSAQSRRPPSLTVEGAKLDASFNSTFGTTLTLPGQLGLTRTVTPSIPEDIEESTSGVNSVKADAYRVVAGPEPTVEVVNETNEVRKRPRSGTGGDVQL
ncbi:sodium channel protein 1 brain-like [Amphiura filiformis]|uniref:sodium channel protein 1 brain-like n=1 Tax=Amphiura filiformis TaxID=82378 RepID=UPI003B228816